MINNFQDVDQYVKRGEISNLTDSSLAVTNMASGGSIGTAPNTVDNYNIFNVHQTTASQTLTLPVPTNTTPEITISVNNVGSAAFTFTAIGVDAGLLARTAEALAKEFE
jgi:hypothetical protein